MARKVTIGLASHWACVTVVYSSVGSRLNEVREMSSLPIWFMRYGILYLSRKMTIKAVYVCVTYRMSLKQLDEMTDGLRRRLLASRDGDQQAVDSESAVPLSTSSALMTAGSTLPDGTWELPSASHSRQHTAPDVMVSTGGSTTTGDAITDLMRRTLEQTGSRNGYIEDMSHSLPIERNHTLADVDVGNSLRDGAANLTGEVPCQVEQQNCETRSSSDVIRYTDSLKNAQMLLEQLKEITACGSQSLAAAGGHHDVDLPITVDFDEDVMQEDDTLANIWALRQSTGRDDADVESLDSTIPPNEPDRSFVSPRTLNDVESNHDDSPSAANHAADDLGDRGDVGDAAELAFGRKQQMLVSGSGESGDTWFIDTRDVRDIDNMIALKVHHRLSESGDDKLPGADKAAEVMPGPPTDVRSPGRPLSHSSPSSLAPFSPAGSPALSAARKSRSLRRTAVQRREQIYHEQHAGSDSNGESGDFVAASRLRHRRPQNSKQAPHHQHTASSGNNQLPVHGASSAAADKKVADVVEHDEEIPTEDHDIEGKDSEPQSTGSNGVAVQPLSANQDPLVVSDDVIVADEQALNGSRSASNEDLYPSECHFLVVMNAFTYFCLFLHIAVC